MRFLVLGHILVLFCETFWCTKHRNSRNCTEPDSGRFGLNRNGIGYSDRNSAGIRNLDGTPMTPWNPVWRQLMFFWVYSHLFRVLCDVMVSHRDVCQPIGITEQQRLHGTRSVQNDWNKSKIWNFARNFAGMWILVEDDGWRIEANKHDAWFILIHAFDCAGRLVDSRVENLTRA